MVLFPCMTISLSGTIILQNCIMPEKRFRCARCRKSYKAWEGLRKHSKVHLNALAEMRMLSQGRMPVESKIGSSFKGKNKVIIS